jgi:tetratricopeptide (TPR) repeat protein
MAERGASRPARWIGLAALALAVALAAAPQTGPDAARQLEAAIHREVVLGDLKGAIEVYRKVLDLAGGNRPVAARALFQIGQCEEKLGNRAAAEDAYQRVAEKYGDQEQAAEARAMLAEWKEEVAGPRNLNFEEGAPGKVPPGWIALALPKDADFLAQLQRKGCRTGSGCAVVQAPPNSPRPFGNMMQSFSATAYRGRTVRLRAWMRLEAVDPDDRGQMWLAVVRANRRNGFNDNMDDRPVRSSQWTQCEIVGEVDRDAQVIDFGFMSSGKGRVWVDDVTFQVVGR